MIDRDFEERGYFHQRTAQVLARRSPVREMRARGELRTDVERIFDDGDSLAFFLRVWWPR